MSSLINDSKRAEDIAAVIKAVGHPLRLRILAVLADGDFRVNDLVDRLGVSQARVSHHLNILRMRGVVSLTREGSASRYALSDPNVISLMNNIEANDQCDSNCSQRY
ncbi:MAG: metalloregulator ArsR/SmtB family transcription factor [Syntrophaceae bacterium]|nr:metalloregulator ArsR/SmtB family transcription factor [Syntrophaceae bacterium]